MSAIESSFGRIDGRLRELLATSLVGAGETITTDALVRMGLERGLFDAGTAHAIGGLLILRDLAESAPPGRGVDADKADEFDTMVRAVLYTLGGESS